LEGELPDSKIPSIFDHTVRNSSTIESYYHLGVIGNQDDSEYTVILIKDAVELLKTENSRAEVYQVENSDHVFSGKEAEVIALIADFMQRKVLV